MVISDFFLKPASLSIFLTVSACNYCCCYFAGFRLTKNFPLLVIIPEFFHPHLIL